MIWTLVFCGTAPAMAVLAKLVSAEVPGAQISLIRFGLQTAFLLIPAIALGRRVLGTGRLRLLLLRGAAIGAASGCMYQGVKLMGVTDAVAILAVEPVLLTIASKLFLAETVGPRRMIACVLGLLGALLIIQPSYLAIGWPALLPLISAGFSTVYFILTRRLAPVADALTMQFYAGLGATLVLAAALAVPTALGLDQYELAMPTRFDWLLMIVIGLLSTSTHVFLVLSFRHAGAAALAPLQYLQIVTGGLLSWLVFSELPNAQTWLGIAIIVGSGTYVFARERRLQAARP